MFLNRISHLLEYSRSKLHGQHRQYIKAVIDDSLIQSIDESIKILEDKFNLTNPFEIILKIFKNHIVESISIKYKKSLTPYLKDCIQKNHLLNV
jgi:hypothetical protein